MQVSVSLPLDTDGFLRRECPECAGQFKWHDGPANAQAEVEPVSIIYHCPLCGSSGAADDWNTQEQLDYARAVAAPAFADLVGDLVEQSLGGLKSDGIRLEIKPSGDRPSEPDPLTEPDDMVIVSSPCHEYEPVKVPEAATSPFHCLVCGAAFSL